MKKLKRFRQIIRLIVLLLPLVSAIVDFFKSQERGRS